MMFGRVFGLAQAVLGEQLRADALLRLIRTLPSTLYKAPPQLFVP